MATATDTARPGSGKLSPRFVAQLDRLGPGEKVRAILFLGPTSTSRSDRRQSREERREAVREVRRAAEPGLRAVDEILRHHHGKRLADEVNALGALPVEVDAAGIRELAREPQVTAIVEDQPVRLLG